MKHQYPRTSLSTSAGADHATNANPDAVIKSSSTPTIVFDCEIPNIRCHVSFDPPLTRYDIEREMGMARELPGELKRYFTPENIKAYKDKLIRERPGRGGEGLNGYGLQSILFNKVQRDGQPGKVGRPVFVFEFANWDHHLMFAERMKEEGLIQHDGNRMSIEDYCVQVYGISFLDFDWSFVEKIPFPQRFSTTLGLIVPRDHKQPELGRCLVIGLRSKQSHTQNPNLDDSVWPVNMSCAEGMLRPDDADCSSEKAGSVPPSPFNTVCRALGKKDELGLADGDFAKDDVRLVAIGYDTQRCQPLAVFMLELDRLDFNDVRARWDDALEKHENRTLFAVPVGNPEEYRRFLRGEMGFEFQGKTKRAKLFSNHQEFAAAVVGEVLFQEWDLHGLPSKVAALKPSVESETATAIALSKIALKIAQHLGITSDDASTAVRMASEMHAWGLRHVTSFASMTWQEKYDALKAKSEYENELDTLPVSADAFQKACNRAGIKINSPRRGRKTGGSIQRKEDIE